MGTKANYWDSIDGDFIMKTMLEPTRRIQSVEDSSIAI